MVIAEAAVTMAFARFIDVKRASRQLERIVIDECHTVLESTEEWRPDLEGVWIGEVGTDDSAYLARRCAVVRADCLTDGWVYTNDMWMNPRSVLLEEWKTSGMTRRRRWTRRIYYDEKAVVQ